MFYPRYKRKTLTTFFRLLYFAVCVNLLWDLEVVESIVLLDDRLALLAS